MALATTVVLHVALLLAIAGHSTSQLTNFSLETVLTCTKADLRDIVQTEVAVFRTEVAKLKTVMAGLEAEVASLQETLYSNLTALQLSVAHQCECQTKEYLGQDVRCRIMHGSS